MTASKEVNLLHQLVPELPSKSRADELKLAKEKSVLFVTLIYPKGIFLTFVFYFKV